MGKEESKDAEMATDEGNQMPFMDTFYSLTSDDPSERSLAASSLLKHVFFQSNTDGVGRDIAIKDGTYALTRLLNGLCSGRASARQGYASCLASFLKISFKCGADGDSEQVWVQHFMKNADGHFENPSEFVRKQFTQSTSLEAPKGEGNKSGWGSKSEEKDHQFGKLFGVLAIVRSGTLSSATPKILNGYVTDLVALYDAKQLFREPSTHALREFFSAVAAFSGLESVGKLIEDTLPTFFNFNSKKENYWTAEKMGLYLHLQTLYMNGNDGNIPKQIHKALLTKKNLNKSFGTRTMKKILANTSSTINTRCNLVWDAIWSYLSEVAEKKKGKGKAKGGRTLRKTLISGDDSPTAIIEALVDDVIVENLLADPIKGSKNNTDGRHLALSLIQQMCQIDLSATFYIHFIFQPTVVKTLFVNTLQKGSKGKQNDKKKNNNALKPLASQILEDLVQSLGKENQQIRICAVKALLRGNPSFDQDTRTETVSALLGFEKSKSSMTSEITNLESQWIEYLHFLMDQVIERVSEKDVEINEAIKYIDVIHTFVKRIMRSVNAESSKPFVQRSLMFFMVGAFFNLGEYESSAMDDDSGGAIARTMAEKIKTAVNCIPYEIRVHMSSDSSPFFSDIVVVKQRDNMSKRFLEEADIVEGAIKSIQDQGAVLVNKINDDDDNDERSNDEGSNAMSRAMQICNEMEALEKNIEDSESESSKTRTISAMRCFASCLKLQLMHPGQPEEIESEAFDEDDGDLSDDILEILSDIFEVASSIAGVSNEGGGDSDDDDSEGEQNSLISLVGICLGTLNSAIGGGGVKSQGGASQMVREFANITWKHALALTREESSRISLDAEVVSALIEAVASTKALAQGEEEANEEDEDMVNIKADDSEEDEGEEMALSFSNALSTGFDSEDEDEIIENSNDNDDDATEEDSNEVKSGDASNDMNIELEPSKLENMLLQDADDESVDADMLEHHEGADGALARLIKMKQEMRKEGQAKKEKVELANKLRCFPLLESVFSNKHSHLLSNQVVLMTILPLLRTRTEFARSINRSGGDSKGEKEAIITKITSLLETKVAKVKLDGLANADACRTVADQIMIQMKKVEDTAHCNCCSILLLLLAKAVGKQGDEDVKLTKSIYSDSVKEWSTKNSTKIRVNLFDELVSRNQSLARSVLTSPLLDACKEGRNIYTKVEAFRILSTIYNVSRINIKNSTEDSLMEEEETKESSSMAALEYNAPAFVSLFVVTLSDVELVEEKRIKAILESVKLFINFACTLYGNTKIWDAVETLEPPISNLIENSSSTSLDNIGRSLSQMIENGIKQHKAKVVELEAEAKAKKASRKKAKSNTSSSAKKEKKKLKKKKSKK
eukprot:CAMPEP_0194072958 /NCGR_PEP_ID=MMETSP0149-20130528/545_1 /TAXON_ID=122233 /ORGANISM="Chaetoceros debilis, Strain MM31A-1" /LENGTH=1357 /DNA_ID=CAMNT_0038752907 /DNA_START=45 /DNA_END=4119 /DNA_ORIENTATION=+